MIRKITTGFVIQQFNDAGKFLSQEFVAGDECEWETEDGEPIDSMDTPRGGNEYHPFNMEQE